MRESTERQMASTVSACAASAAATYYSSQCGRPAPGPQGATLPHPLRIPNPNFAHSALTNYVAHFCTDGGTDQNGRLACLPLHLPSPTRDPTQSVARVGPTGSNLLGHLNVPVELREVALPRLFTVRRRRYSTATQSSYASTSLTGRGDARRGRRRDAPPHMIKYPA